MLLDHIDGPADLRRLDYPALDRLAAEIRDVVVETVNDVGGHLGSNLGAVELTLALHRVFDSPNDLILWDTGHQAYIHKLVTGRRNEFPTIARPAGCPATRAAPSPSTTGSRTRTRRPCCRTPTGSRPRNTSRATRNVGSSRSSATAR
jgi:1-deoxy-D-xylulose-5-phosphate synthase